MNVLIIAEDFRKDQYVLKPLVQAMLRALGRPRARVDVCREPLLMGVSQAMNWNNLEEILDDHRGMVDLYLLCVDRDGESQRRMQLDHLERKAKAILPQDTLFLAENAWQEIEVWVLAGHDLPPSWSWRAVREEIHPKEVYFDPFASVHGISDELGGGRKTLAQAAARRYDRIRRLCPEDVFALEARIMAWLQHRS